jgi:hypothetical protein
MQVFRVAEPFSGNRIAHAKEDRSQGENRDGQAGAFAHAPILGWIFNRENGTSDLSDT